MLSLRSILPALLAVAISAPALADARPPSPARTATAKAAATKSAAAKARAAKARAAARGLAFAQTHCAACHGVTANAPSPNPESPPFDDIANWPGVTKSNFAAFLTDAHNYPLAMDVTVPRVAIQNLATYMMTLRKPGYKPTR